MAIDVAATSPGWQRGTPLRISFLGFNPLGDGYDGRGLIDFGADRTFTSLDTLGAIRLIRHYFDSDGDGRLSRRDGPPFDLRITGYSFGAWSALQVVHRLGSIGTRFRIRIGLVDPIDTFRSRGVLGLTLASALKWQSIKTAMTRFSLPAFAVRRLYASRPDSVIFALNYYQTRGLIARTNHGTGWRIPYPSKWFASGPIAGFENRDVSSEVTDAAGHCDIADRYAREVARRTFQD